MNADYHEFREDLELIDSNLRSSMAESMAIEFALEALPQSASPADRERRARFAVVALRMELLRHLLGLPSFRSFSRSLASSDLLADFCGVRDLEGIKWSSKSTVDRASKLFTPEQLTRMNQLLSEVCANGDLCADVGLEQAIDASVCLVDSTCLEANIHYPVDWVLLRDVSRTLLKAIKLIRGEGLLNRMSGGAEALATEMNRLCIDMAMTHRRKDGKKRRKAVFRQMKKLLRRIGKHALKHREMLHRQQGQTNWSPRQAERILERIDKNLQLIPEVIHQAHERIIGGRLIQSKDKILSTHQDDLHTLVRHKAGKPVEFGNGLFLAESPEGFILDYKLYQEAPPVDTKKLLESLDRQQAFDIEHGVKDVVGDRGFDSRQVAKDLADADIDNRICPRDSVKLKEQMSDQSFARWQKRRASTEARIAILKNNGGRKLRAKGFNNRAASIGFGVLAHNLWWIARNVRENRKDEPVAA